VEMFSHFRSAFFETSYTSLAFRRDEESEEWRGASCCYVCWNKQWIRRSDGRVKIVYISLVWKHRNTARSRGRL
jgi:hypothetical protein